jgi:hypothetical protein
MLTEEELKKQELKKQALIQGTVGVVTAVIASAVMLFLAIPSYQARSDERIIGLKENNEENKRRIETLESQLKDNRDRTSEMLREVSASRNALNDNIALSSALEEKISLLDQSLKEIKNIDPIAEQCADIMRQILQQTSLDAIYGSTRKEDLTALYERFNCPSR